MELELKMVFEVNFMEENESEDENEDVGGVIVIINYTKNPINEVLRKAKKACKLTKTCSNRPQIPYGVKFIGWAHE